MADLFGDAPPAPAPKPRAVARNSNSNSSIGPAEITPALAALAARISPRLYLGTSSWYFPGWAGIVYDRAAPEAKVSREGLKAYAQHPLLKSVSVDRAFYQPLNTGDYARYAAQVSAHFRFTVKAWRGVTDPQIEGTHNPLFLDADYAREAILKPFLDGCGEKAGVWVMQFSPELPRRARLAPSAFAERLGAFLHALQSPIPVAVELRDAELLTPAYFAALKSSGAVHAVNVHPTGLSVIEQIQRIGERPEPLVIRWMLHAGFAYEEARERYAPFDRLVDEDLATRQAVARIARRALDAGGTVYVIANNKAEGSAPLTLFKLAEAIAGVSP
jgi:uncharacterized protein YecE (DUF72 family)